MIYNEAFEKKTTHTHSLVYINKYALFFYFLIIILFIIIYTHTHEIKWNRKNIEVKWKIKVSNRK